MSIELESDLFISSHFLTGSILELHLDDAVFVNGVRGRSVEGECRGWVEAGHVLEADGSDRVVEWFWVFKQWEKRYKQWPANPRMRE